MFYYFLARALSSRLLLHSNSSSYRFAAETIDIHDDYYHSYGFLLHLSGFSDAYFHDLISVFIFTI